MKKIGLYLLLSAFVLFTAYGAGKSETSKKDPGFNYPTKPISVIVPWGAGGGTDVTARGLLKVAEKYVGTSFVVTNVTGGAGSVGWVASKNAKPDGYSLVVLTADLLTHSVKKNSGLSYSDFVPVINMSKYPACLAVAVDAPWKDLASFIEDARKNPGKIRVGNSGLGGTNHQAVLMLEDVTGTTFGHVPFKGGADSIAAVLGGNIEATLANTPEIAPRPDMRMLVQYASGKRNSSAPDVPTLKELGYAVELESFRMLGVLKDTPAEIVSFLEAKFKQAWDDPEFQELAEKGKLSPDYLDVTSSKSLLGNMHEAVKRVIEKTGL